MNSNIILISACLLDIPCRYSGKLASKRLDKSIVERHKYIFIPVCPEQLAGLPTPRHAVEIRGGSGFDVLGRNAKIVTKEGEDYTEFFIRGAEITLKICEMLGLKKMITQLGSPSCSCNGIYDGTFTDVLVDGFGVTAALLTLHGIELNDVCTFEKHTI